MTMVALRVLLMIVGIGLFGSAAAVVGYDVVLATRLRWLLQRSAASSKDGKAAIQPHPFGAIRPTISTNRHPVAPKAVAQKTSKRRQRFSREAASAVATIASEAQMTHYWNHRDLPVQKAGQAVATALHQPLPSKQVSRCDSDRVAGGETMGNRTSTAALGWFCSGSLENQRRVPSRQGIRGAEAPCAGKL